MKKQIPHAAESAGFGMPILRGIGISNRNTPELETWLSHVGSTRGCLLIATLFEEGENANRRSATSRNRKSQGQKQVQNPRRRKARLRRDDKV